jgi:S1-C subfamily serine protease
MHDFSPSRDPIPPPIPPEARLPTSADRAQTAPARRPSFNQINSPSKKGGSHVTLSRVIGFLIVLLILQYALPFLIERYEYAVTRGRQRAEYEAATQGLEGLQLVGLSQAYQMVSQQVGPSVVHIDVRSIQVTRDTRDLAQLYGPRFHESRGQGSGVIVDEGGFIVTNCHVVDGAAEILVSLSDGRTFPARIVGADALTDLAVLKIAADGLMPAEWGDSDAVQAGALVWAVGSPFGLQSTITSGIISATHRRGKAGKVHQDFLQTDAAVNPGNSGGPLVDVHGQVIGINTAIKGDSYLGISFAIPSKVAKDVYLRLRADGRVARGWLGVELEDVSAEIAQSFGLPEAKGALVVGVVDVPGVPTPAKDAGIRLGDVVTGWNGEAVASSADLIRMVAKTEIGSTTTVTLIRQGRAITVEVIVAERPARADR